MGFITLPTDFSQFTDPKEELIRSVFPNVEQKYTYLAQRRCQIGGERRCCRKSQRDHSRFRSGTVVFLQIGSHSYELGSGSQLLNRTFEFAGIFWITTSQFVIEL